MTVFLVKWGFVSLEAVFIDGTKIEANANRYSFVWKKSTEKSMAKPQAKIAKELPTVVASSGVKFHIPEAVEIRHLKKLRKKLYEKHRNENIVFVNGKGHHKTVLQKAVETVEEWLPKLKWYTRDLHICGDRNQLNIRTSGERHVGTLRMFCTFVPSCAEVFNTQVRILLSIIK